MFQTQVAYKHWIIQYHFLWVLELMKSETIPSLRRLETFSGIISFWNKFDLVVK